MVPCRFPGCTGTTEYDESAQAVLCTACGTVTTQDILTYERDGEWSGSSVYFGPTTLRSLRRVGGVLAGQSKKEDRDRRNTIAMHQYILGVLTKLTCPGLAPRAQSLFDRARAHGNYRWGKKAVLVAGACIAIALRESRKGVMMSHLTSFMDVSPHALCRIFTQINDLLALGVPPFDPLSLLPTLQSHLNFIISSPSCPLPQATVKMLEHLPPTPVLQLATSLATLLNRLDEFTASGKSLPPTACALFITALEGQASSSLPSYTTLAQELGKKVGAGQDLVVGRYRAISKIIEEWMADVPWIHGADHPDNRLGKKRRKTSQRDAIAMGLKDVVRFQEDIMTARKVRERGSPVTVMLEVPEDDEDSGRNTDGSTPAPGEKRKRSQSMDASAVSPKHVRLARPTKAKSPLSGMDLASLSLLSPAHPFSSLPHPKRRSAQASEVDALQTHILTSATPLARSAPTRLQRLVALRGGERGIDDTELFEDGELDGFLRSDDEVVNLRELYGWNGPDLSLDTRERPAQATKLGFDLDVVEMTAWEDLGGDQDGEFTDGEQVLGEWREASPSAEGVENVDRFEVHGEW